MKCLNKECRENLYDMPPLKVIKCPYCKLEQVHLPDNLSETDDWEKLD